MSGKMKSYATGMLMCKRERVAEELQKCTTSELEQLVKNGRPCHDDSERDLVLEVGLFGSESDPLIKAGAAYDILRERKGELYAYSLIGDPEHYPVRNWRTSLGSYVASIGGFLSFPLGAFVALQDNFQDPDYCSAFVALGIINTLVSVIGGAVIHERGRNYGLQCLYEEMAEKSGNP